jgi:site-specific DNA-methyltransferase (adenine-specific)
VHIVANDHILSWSNEGDIVLDPMMGSGTVGKMAKLNKRNFIGIEISPEYFAIAERRINNTSENLL